MTSLFRTTPSSKLFITLTIFSHLTSNLSHGLLSKAVLPKTISTPRSFPPLQFSTADTWESLQSLLPETDQPEPLVTLYRDTNGWCPFCERIWIALRAKNIPYRERLINLQDKPKWFLDMVPTGLVPAVMFHNEDNTTTSRSIVWESAEILKELDERFPDSPRLVYEDNEEFVSIREFLKDVTTAGFAFNYAKNGTAEEIAEKRDEFVRQLGLLDTLLAKNSEDEPFLLGAQVTSVDLEMVPLLERWRYQVPITSQLDILENHPHLQKWFRGMDSFLPYSERVAGDRYSWSAVTSTFVKMFGTAEGEVLERADANAASIRASFAHEDVSGISRQAREEAAAKLCVNHEAVVRDCTREDPKTQADLGRASNPINADLALTFVVKSLLQQDGEGVVSPPLEEFQTIADALDAAKAMRTVAGRLCVPRDMGAPAAKVLRKTLCVIAGMIEEAVKEKESASL